jgi:hypothetical protein
MIDNQLPKMPKMPKVPKIVEFCLFFIKMERGDF